MTTFNLRDHIRQTLAETREENLHILVSKVFDSTPRANIREAYRQALTDAVRDQMPTAPRPDHVIPDTQNGPIGAGQDSTGEGHTRVDTHIPPTLPGGGNVRNSRAAMFRKARFSLSVCVERDTYRNILECTAANLMFAAEQRDQLAEQNAAAAERYRQLAKLLVEREADTVADLSDEEIAALVEGLTNDG